MADDQLVRKYVSNGHEVRQVESLVEQMHPHVFDAADGGPTATDDRGNVVTVDVCPDCGGEYRAVLSGPDASHVFYSERLMHPCGHPNQDRPAHVQPRDALTDDPFTVGGDDDLADLAD